jgi:hypothetical protein
MTRFQKALSVLAFLLSISSEEQTGVQYDDKRILLNPPPIVVRFECLGNMYLLDEELKEWSTVHETGAMETGMQLVSIRNPEEECTKAALISLGCCGSTETDIDNILTGGKYQGPLTGWKRVGDDTVFRNNVGTDLGYTNWAIGQPPALPNPECPLEFMNGQWAASDDCGANTKQKALYKKLMPRSESNKRLFTRS